MLFLLINDFRKLVKNTFSFNSHKLIIMRKTNSYFILFVLFITLCTINVNANVTFEKMTNRDYAGTTYYTIRNVSLYECLGWCREELECSAAAFSFIVNPLAPVQDTTCKLLNDTVSQKLVSLPTEVNLINGSKEASKLSLNSQINTKNTNKGSTNSNGHFITTEATMVSISLQPQKAANLYFFNKIKLDSDTNCNRLWNFERYPNKMLRGLESLMMIKSTKDACLSACQSETKFVCRSVEYNYLTSQCHLSQYDRRSSNSAIDLVDQDGVDYFENSCIESGRICMAQRDYDYVKIGIALNKISYYVEINYYPDKELLVKSQVGCIRACTIENEFICRSILYRSNYKPGQPNCALYHLDHFTLPDGLDTFSVQFNVPLPLFDTGDGTDSIYLEAYCTNSSVPLLQQQQLVSPVAMPSIGRPTIVGLPSTSTLPPTKTSTFIKQQTTQYLDMQQTQKQALHQHKNIHNPEGIKSSIASSLTTSVPGFNNAQTTKVYQHSQVMMLPSKTSSSSKGTGSLVSPLSNVNQNNLNLAHLNNITIGTTTDPSCDSYGVCYQVSLRCTDTRILVQVQTSQPFHGRIYALGRSETCNNKIHNSQYFSLEMSLIGQQCNTQNVQGVYSNTVVLQHHNVVLTKADKVYHVRCTYETTSRNVSFGMVPVRDAVMGSGFGTEAVEVSASPEAPLPRIVIESGEGREANTVRVGDKLTFRIAIPDNTPYGIFARSCIAMAKDAKSTFEIIDENGCPVDNSIFPAFQLNGNALESTYEAFRFTESYGVIFQCNVKYCIGRCDPIICNGQLNQGVFGREIHIQSYGRRRKRETFNIKNLLSNNTNRLPKSPKNKPKASTTSEEMTLSHEILVLDFNDPDPQRSDSEFNNLNAKEMMLNMDYCASTTSLMALSIICALLLILYVCTVAYFISNQRNYQNNCKSFY